MPIQNPALLQALLARQQSAPSPPPQLNIPPGQGPTSPGVSPSVQQTPYPTQATPGSPSTTFPGVPPTKQPSVPSVPPSGGQTNTPPQATRFANAQQLMDAYRNGWSPNPLLLRALLGHK